MKAAAARDSERQLSVGQVASGLAAEAKGEAERGRTGRLASQ